VDSRTASPSHSRSVPAASLLSSPFHLPSSHLCCGWRSTACCASNSA
jgi:hypothetical protein